MPGRARVLLTAVVLAVACVHPRTAPLESAIGSPGSLALAQELQRVDGGIVRGPVSSRRLALVFTGHEYAEGASVILDTLARHRATASFFLTGAFLRTREFAPIVHRFVREGHYVGPHSDAHLLYCPWEGPRVTLVSRATFEADLQRNVDELERFGVARRDVRYFLPPYEWYNAEIAEWTRGLGMTLVNFTRGTRSSADYTEEGTPQFVPSQAIFDSIIRRERDDPNGLNGFLLLLHLGAGPGRADKFHDRFGALMDVLAARGYAFVRLDTLLGAGAGREPSPNPRNVLTSFGQPPAGTAH